MEDEWEDLGEAGNVADQIVSTVSGGGGETGGVLGDYRNVIHKETIGCVYMRGQHRVVHRGYGQTTGEAIANGQFADEEE